MPWKNVIPMEEKQRFVSLAQGENGVSHLWENGVSHLLLIFAPLAGHWSLVTGYWLLVTGHWILVTGYWSEAVLGSAFLVGASDGLENLPLRQALETSLGEMVVSGESFFEILGFHDCEACAIGEGICFVSKSEKLGSCRLQNIPGNILDPHAGAGRDGLPPDFCCGQPEAHAQQGQRFINHIVGEQEGPARSKPVVSGGQGILVNRVVFVCTSHPA